MEQWACKSSTETALNLLFWTDEIWGVYCLLMDKCEEFWKLEEVMRYSVFLIPRPSGRCCSPNPNSAAVVRRVFFCSHCISQFLPDPLSSPSTLFQVFLGPSHCLQVLTARQMACPVSPPFFCSFFCSKFSTVNVFNGAGSLCRELWFVWKHLLHLHSLWASWIFTSGIVWTQKLIKLRMCIKSTECRLCRCDTIYNFSLGFLVFFSLFPHVFPPSLSHLHSGFPPFPYEFRVFFSLSLWLFPVVSIECVFSGAGRSESIRYQESLMNVIPVTSALLRANMKVRWNL